MKIKTHFPASRGEVRAVVITSLVICLSVILPPHLVGLIQTSTTPLIEISEYQPSDSNSLKLPKVVAFTKTDSMRKQIANGQTSEYIIKPHTNKPSNEHAMPGNNSIQYRQRCATFDPNVISGDSLRTWGVRAYVVNNILKYRSSGGKFREKSDLLRIYGMDSATYHLLENCIVIERIGIPTVFVNTADTTQWMTLPGIGPILSKRIVKFRDYLGGFSQIGQVADTYGLTAESFEIIKPYLRLRKKPNSIDLAIATEDQLASHPYISRKQARSMINYFGQHGRPNSIDELNKLYFADSTWLARITPYCTFGLKTSN